MVQFKILCLIPAQPHACPHSIVVDEQKTFPPCVPQQFCSLWAPRRNSVCNPYCLSTKTLTGPCLPNNSFTSQGPSDYFLRALAAVAPSGHTRSGPVWICLVHTAPVSPHGHVCWDISHQPHYLKLETSTPKKEKTVEVQSPALSLALISKSPPVSFHYSVKQT